MRFSAGFPHAVYLPKRGTDEVYRIPHISRYADAENLLTPARKMVETSP